METIAVDDPNVTGSGTTTITIDPVSELEYSTDYYIEIGGDAFYDENNNYFAGISGNTTFNFQTKSNLVSSGSSRRVLKVTPPQVPVILPSNSPLPCTDGALFSNSTGAPCNPSSNLGPSVPSIPSMDAPKFIFTKSLWTQMIDPDVKELQKYLNTHGYPIALSGAGSLGNETIKFGNLTRDALIKFQLANNITPAVGFFGPMTRGVVNQ